MITINIGKPRISLRKTTDEGEQESTGSVESIFCAKNLVLLGSGIALGIILKQQADIRTLKGTVAYLQGVIK